MRVHVPPRRRDIESRWINLIRKLEEVNVIETLNPISNFSFLLNDIIDLNSPKFQRIIYSFYNNQNCLLPIKLN